MPYEHLYKRRSCHPDPKFDARIVRIKRTLDGHLIPNVMYFPTKKVGKRNREKPPAANHNDVNNSKTIGWR